MKRQNPKSKEIDPAKTNEPDRPIGRTIPIPAERHARILEFLSRHGAASIHAIAAELSVSASTIRRDLDDLTETGYLERSHGGAVLRSRTLTTFEPSREIAERLALSEKIAIGAFAASLLENNQSVIFDSSSTVAEAARAVVARDMVLTAISTDIGIAQELNKSPRIRVIVPGGTMRKESLTLTGDPALGLLATINVEVGLIGIHSLAGLKPSETTLEIAAMKKALIAACQHIVLLADSTKFTNPAFCEVAKIEAFHHLVTDDGITDELRHALNQRGIKVTAVPRGLIK
jgi:DeoR family transcriptional regulator of aga operon